MMRKPFAITLDPGSSLANHTGTWRTMRPVYVDRMPPCNDACPAGENIQGWLFHAESGDFTKGAGLGANAIERVLAFTQAGGSDRRTFCDELERIVGDSAEGRTGVGELRQIDAALNAAGYGEARVRFDPSVVRGLAYYTGPVIEAELTFETRNEDGQLVRFGSVAGGGRYDDLVTRFKGVQVPATGISIGVSRLQAALAARGREAVAERDHDVAAERQPLEQVAAAGVGGRLAAEAARGPAQRDAGAHHHDAPHGWRRSPEPCDDLT